MHFTLTPNQLAELLETKAESEARGDLKEIMHEVREHDDSEMKRDLIVRAAEMLGFTID